MSCISSSDSRQKTTDLRYSNDAWTHSDSQTPHRGVSRRGFLGLLDSLETCVRGMRWQPGESAWSDYYETSTYSEESLQTKSDIVDAWLEQLQPSEVWDLGANTGVFSRTLVDEMELDARAIRIPAPVARALATAGERVFQVFGKPKPPVSMVEVRLCVKNSYFSIEKARRDLEYQPIVDTREGLKRTAKDAREYYDSL